MGWSDFPSFRKHRYSLPTVGNIVGVLKFNILEDVLAILCEWWLGVEMVGMIYIYISVLQDCMSSLFMMVESFWMLFWEYIT